MKFYLNNDLKYYQQPELPVQFVQYSTEEILIYTPFVANETTLERNLIVSIIRPDGFKTNEMFAEFLGEDPSSPGTYIWRSNIVPYHTAVIPGVADIGNMIISFMVKEYENAALTDVISSSVIRIAVYRSIEPNVEFIEPTVAEDFDRRLNAVEAGHLDHSALTYFSRNKPNQHTIDAITGLRPKVDIYIDSEEPIEQVDTWFDVEAVDDEVPTYTNWDLLASTPLIFENAVINCFSFTSVEPTKLVAIGDLAGEMYRNELHSDEFGNIEGEVLVYVSENYADIASVFVRLEKVTGQSVYEVVEFTNTGNLEIFDFTALSIEVYR